MRSPFLAAFFVLAIVRCTYIEGMLMTLALLILAPKDWP